MKTLLLLLLTFLSSGVFAQRQSNATAIGADLSYRGIYQQSGVTPINSDFWLKTTEANGMFLNPRGLRMDSLFAEPETGSIVRLMGFGTTSKVGWLSLSTVASSISTMVTPSWSNIVSKPTFASVATSGDYNDLINKPSIPASQVNSDWDAASGVEEILNKPDLSVYATNVSLATKLNISDFESYFNTGLSEKTTSDITEGSNEYWTNAKGDARYPRLSGSYNDPSWLTGIDWNKVNNAPNTLGGYGIIDAASDFELSAVSFNRIPNPLGDPTPISAGARNFNTAYQISSSNASEISLSVEMSCVLTSSGGQGGDIILEVSQDGLTNWIYVAQFSASNTGTLTAGLTTTQVTGGQLKVSLPIEYYWRLRTNTTTGSPTYTFNGGSYRVYTY